MRSIIPIVVVFAAGAFLGHRYWPESHDDPGFRFRFHRGHAPYPPEKSVPPPHASPSHGRILHVNSPTPTPEPTPP